MKYLNLINNIYVKILLIIMLIPISIFLYIKYIFSCEYLYTFSNNDLVSMLEKKDNNIFLLTQSIKACRSTKYNNFLLKALKENFVGHILIFKINPIGVEANYALNYIYNKDYYYYNEGFGEKDGNYNSKQDALKETHKTIENWNNIVNADNFMEDKYEKNKK